jgi:hypothetical protein
VEAFQGGVFVIAVERRVGNLAVFEVLNEMDGEKAFAHAAFAIEN